MANDSHRLGLLPNPMDHRLATTGRLLDALVADLAKGIEPDVIAKRHEERKRLEDELDGS